MKKVFRIILCLAIWVGFLMVSCGKDGGDEANNPPANNLDAGTITVNGVSFRMKKIEGGTFMMGAIAGDAWAYDNEKPQHSATVDDFYIGETEVTQELWQAVMGSNPSNFSGANLPVERVSWYECDTFITRLSDITGLKFRLPTEVEWEYAARGGSRYSGNNNRFSGSDNIDTVGWYTENSKSTTHPVKTKLPNELGLYDMTGNVYEWCSTWYGGYSSSSNSGAYRILRGGSYYNCASNCRATYRNYNTPGAKLDNYGLRLAATH